MKGLTQVNRQSTDSFIPTRDSQGLILNLLFDLLKVVESLVKMQEFTVFCMRGGRGGGGGGGGRVGKLAQRELGIGGRCVRERRWGVDELEHKRPTSDNPLTTR